jgi:hypothetical protein
MKYDATFGSESPSSESTFCGSWTISQSASMTLPAVTVT